MEVTSGAQGAAPAATAFRGIYGWQNASRGNMFPKCKCIADCLLMITFLCIQISIVPALCVGFHRQLFAVIFILPTLETVHNLYIYAFSCDVVLLACVQDTTLCHSFLPLLSIVHCVVCWNVRNFSTGDNFCISLFILSTFSTYSYRMHLGLNINYFQTCIKLFE